MRTSVATDLANRTPRARTAPAAVTVCYVLCPYFTKISQFGLFFFMIYTVKMARDLRYDEFFKILIEERQKNNLTQKEVATRLGKPQSYVSKYKFISSIVLSFLNNLFNINIFSMSFLSAIFIFTYSPIFIFIYCQVFFNYIFKSSDQSRVVCRITREVTDGLPARTRALRSKDQGWQNVGVGRRGNGFSHDLADRNPGGGACRRRSCYRVLNGGLAFSYFILHHPFMVPHSWNDFAIQ